MPVANLTVEAYPFDGAAALIVEERTAYGWVEVLDESSIGTFPEYVIAHEVTGTGSGEFRYRWELANGGHTSWLAPSVAVPATAQVTDRLHQALLAKACRLYMLAQAPLGTHGEVTEFGVARVMPDHQISELLTGLLRVNWDVELEALVTPAEVIRTLGYEELPAGKTDDVELAISAAASWVASYILGAVAIS